MRVKRLAILAFVLILACGRYTFAHIVEGPLDQVRLQFREPREVVEIYLQAVGRGELVIFGRKLNKAMVVPVSVEYVYELKSATPRVKVYSELKEPMPVPDQENCELRGVSAILDAEGRIIETEAHIWQE